MKKQNVAVKITALSLLLGTFGLIAQSAQAAVEISQDDQYVYYKWKYGDMEDFRQAAVRDAFIDLVRQKMQGLHLPPTLEKASEAQLTSSVNALGGDITFYENQARALRTKRGLEVQDFIPSGLIFAMGGNGSLSLPSVPLGAGGSIMFDAACAPIHTLAINKLTGAESDYTELNADFGGLAEFGFGISESAGASGRFAAGLIFGDLPNVSTLIGNGFAEGLAADVDVPFLGGLGITALASSKNPTTGLRNIVVFGMRDVMGPKAGVEDHIVSYYFADETEVGGWFGDSKLGTTPNNPIPITTPSPAPSLVGGPVVKPADGSSDPTSSNQPVTTTIKPLDNITIKVTEQPK